ncbi:diguanylate cyclase (GGDEF) domain-containing protein [Paracoccus isoporae]|uniref:diguanylate cyclase n=1 Tax=Paracoccus isoporae TaxID=591205 RepID=A0A1G7BDX8_9RHOB|nr:GGDEF domain-containing protein [Paracoccus isoporae]SDE25233.1 diguanylate cyclase (GGDEF) domain-containing protein [Paracoccus isoporae]
MGGGRAIAVERLAALMPMHLQIDENGAILSCGPTLRKLIGRARHVATAFELRRAPPDALLIPAIIAAARSGERVFLGLRDSDLPPLRGEAMILPADAVLINLGFGIGVIDAVARYDLTDADFAANELAIEIMYLHKSSQAIRAELARHSHHLEQARETAEMQAFTDPLTGLLNRRGFELAFSLAIEARRAPEGRRQEFSVLQIDLDWFKQVNDRFGHAAGDAVLRRLAEILRQETRAEDSLARIGGDEFLILLPALTSETALRQLGRRMIASIQQPIRFDANLCQVSASIGAALSERYDELTAEQILSDADAALYTAKRDGRGRMHIHCPGDDCAGDAGGA